MTPPLRLFGMPAEIETSIAESVLGQTLVSVNSDSVYRGSATLDVQAGLRFHPSSRLSTSFGLAYGWTGNQSLQSFPTAGTRFASNIHFFGVTARLNAYLLPDRISLFGGIGLGVPYHNFTIGLPTGEHRVEGINPLMGITWDLGAEFSPPFAAGRFTWGLILYYRGENGTQGVDGDSVYRVSAPPPTQAVISSTSHSLMIGARFRFH